MRKNTAHDNIRKIGTYNLMLLRSHFLIITLLLISLFRFYPYHYAPFASDFHGLDKLKVDFALGKPFKPFDQLMSVLPAASAQALPLLYRDLMTNPSSPILDFYPTEFELDLNGRKQDWKAVCRLPFIDENRLLTEISKVEHSLTDAERRRNILGLDKIFIDMSHPLAAKILTFLERNKYHPKLHKAKVKRKINPKLSGGMNGYIYISDKPICPTEISSPLRVMKKTVIDNKVMLVFYKCPHFHPHIARPPKGVIMPRKFIKKRHLKSPPTLWHEKTAIVQSRFIKSNRDDQERTRKRSRDALNDKRKKYKKRNKRRKLN